MLKIECAESKTSHNSSFSFNCDSSHDWWLLIQTHSTTCFIIKDEEFVMPPYTAILYPPHTEIHYKAANDEPYCDDWVRFYTDESFVNNGVIPLETPFRTNEYTYISEVINLIAAENFFNNKNKELTIQSLFQVLFFKLNESLSGSSDDFRTLALYQLHQNIKTNPSFPWTISYMAKQLFVCPRLLHKFYYNEFGVSCMQDVIKNRIILAKKHLSETDYSIKKIANLCGYSNTEHFSRQFKKETGISPKQFREQLK